MRRCISFRNPSRDSMPRACGAAEGHGFPGRARCWTPPQLWLRRRQPVTWLMNWKACCTSQSKIRCANWSKPIDCIGKTFKGSIFTWPRSGLGVRNNWQPVKSKSRGSNSYQLNALAQPSSGRLEKANSYRKSKLLSVVSPAPSGPQQG
jgi:hypothetical protein